ncbi:hypothetical protein JCM10212_002094 [Sporobolomyces blumeae]
MTDDTAPSPALAALLASTRPTSAPLDPSRQRASLSTIGATSPPTRSTQAKSVHDGPIPMSMPAILQQPKNKHLLGALGGKKRDDGTATASSKKHKDHGAPSGKRRRRRWENAQLAGNPHLHRPTRSDFAPGPSLKNLSTTFAPPPSNFSRSTYSAPESPAASDSDTSSFESGQFSLSLRGLRRNLRANVGTRVRRGEGGRTEEVLDIMERELRAWISFEGKVQPGFFHDGALSSSKALDPTPLDECQPRAVDALPDEPASTRRPPPAAPPTLVELTRLPHTLVWLAPSPQHRFLLHALARYYRLQSFSRALSPLDPDTRVTHILRPQLARPRPPATAAVANGFETPPTTDWSSTGATTEGSELSSGTEMVSSDAMTESEGDLSASEDDWDRASLSYGSESGGRDLAELSSGDSDYGADHDAGSTTEEELLDDAAVDSLASSFADLSSREPVVLEATPSTPRAAPFVPFVPSTPTPAPPSLLSAVLSSSTPRPSRARGRRSIPTGSRAGLSSAESSPSRSPTRAAVRTPVVAREDWRMPETGFVDWVFE